MIKIAKRQYNVQPGETITVDVQATGTAHGVNQDLDGAGGAPLGVGQSLTFKVEAPKNHRVLSLLFTFTNSSGGKYAVKIKGGQGGSDTDEVDQGSFGIPATETEYRFQL
jgi:hypothetical protein